MSIGWNFATADTEIPTPWVAFKTYWVDVSTGTIKVWNGSSWDQIAPTAVSGGIWIMAPYIKGVITEANMECLVHIPTEPITIPSTATNKTKAKAKVAATGTTTFTMHKNGGASFGTIVWSAAGTLGAVTVASSVSFDPSSNDWLNIIGPATPDATLANIGISVHAER